LTGSQNPGRRKLIEVALPLTAISAASKADKDRKTGTVRSVHKWFAPMPGPAIRALVLASVLDDSEDPQARLKDLSLIESMVPADGGAPREEDLRRVRARLRQQDELPTIIDPFCGGGSTLVESQRLGLAAIGSDLNPVPTLISKILAELVPQFRDQSPLAPDSGRLPVLDTYGGVLHDLQYYAKLIQERVYKAVASAYPPGTDSFVAWLWCRTVPCPNPACGRTAPLYGLTHLSKLKRDYAYLVPQVTEHGVVHRVATGPGVPQPPSKQAGKSRFICLACTTPFDQRYIRQQAQQGKMGLQLLADVRAVDGRRVYSADTPAAGGFGSPGMVEIPLVGKAAMNVGLYGISTLAGLFTSRQAATLESFAAEIGRVQEDIAAAGGSSAYVSVLQGLLSLALGKLAQSNCALVRWRIDSRSGSAKAEPAFGTQAVPMLWDFAETNPFGASVGSWMLQVDGVAAAVRTLPKSGPPASVSLAAAQDMAPGREAHALLITDPPYFDQIQYADISDFFYYFHRAALREAFPALYGTVTTPKSVELVANPWRHGGDADAARDHFVVGFQQALASLSKTTDPDLPKVVVYAAAQDEHGDDRAPSTAWESLLEAIVLAGLMVVATWPIFATGTTRQIGQGANALASYVVLVLRPRPEEAETVNRRAFLAALAAELPAALASLRHVAIPPMDLPQATIGPGMAVFTRYRQVMEPNGRSMSVGTALALINQVLDEVLTEQEGDFDSDTRFCLKWFSQYGWEEASSGTADSLARAANTSVAALDRGGVFRARAGRARLLAPAELSAGWDPVSDLRTSVWEGVVRIAQALEALGADEAARLMSAARQRIDLDAARELTYLLYSICEKRGWTQTAALFNGLGTSWSDLSAVARVGGAPTPPSAQGALDFDGSEQ
jgi:putative DNA methylase